MMFILAQLPIHLKLDRILITKAITLDCWIKTRFITGKLLPKMIQAFQPRALYGNSLPALAHYSFVATHLLISGTEKSIQLISLVKNAG